MIAATYRLAGVRQKPARVCFDPALIHDPEAWLTARLGPLGCFTLDATAETSAKAETSQSETAVLPKQLDKVKQPDRVKRLMIEADLIPIVGTISAVISQSFATMVRGGCNPLLAANP